MSSGKNTAPFDLKGERTAILSLGCARNTVDSEKILLDAQHSGARISPLQKASVVLVNTCAFTTEAKQESIDVILDLIALKKKGKIRKIGVYGCLAQRYPGELKKNFKEIDDFRGIADFKQSFDSRIALTPVHYAYLKIAEGCANFCSYCAISGIKGDFRGRDESSILREARFLEDIGVRELNIIGQDITLFDRQGSGLVGLLEKILAATRIPWIRLLYLHPSRVSDDLIGLIAGERRMCPYFDVPLQHINDRILKLMNRGINRRGISRLIDKIRVRLPLAAIRTSFIVGFPSESPAEFQELLDFVRETKFEKLGAFRYSREEGTPAFSLPGQIRQKTKERRLEALLSLQQEISRDIQKIKIGRRIELMVCGPAAREKYRYLARSRYDAPEVDGVVFLDARQKLKNGAIVSGRVTDSADYDLTARAEEI